MTMNDTIRILDKVCRLYITQAKKLTDEERSSMLESWYETFKSDSYDDVEKAVSSYLRKGNAFIPLPGDIIKELPDETKAISGKPYTEVDALFKKLVNTVDILANNKERVSLVDPGGFKWDDELKRNVYFHAETLVSTRSFTQYDFANLPPEIQEYVEDIEGLRSLWPEIQSSREMAKRRFEKALPGIKAEIAKRSERIIKEHMERLEQLRNEEVMN